MQWGNRSNNRSGALELRRAFACPSAPGAAWRSGFWAPAQSESPSRRGPRLQSPRRKPSVPLGKGFGSARPPPASRLPPQLPRFDEHWGNESPALKILWFYLDKKKNLACLHWHIKIVLVWVNLQSFSWWKYLASLFFFFFNLWYKFIYRVSFFPPTLSRHLQKVATRLVRESWNNLQGLWNIIVLHSCDAMCCCCMNVSYFNVNVMLAGTFNSFFYFRHFTLACIFTLTLQSKNSLHSNLQFYILHANHCIDN